MCYRGEGVRGLSITSHVASRVDEAPLDALGSKSAYGGSRWRALSAAPEAGAKTGMRASRTHRIPDLSCPQCGFAYGWNGETCAHCRFEDNRVHSPNYQRSRNGAWLLGTNLAILVCWLAGVFPIAGVVWLFWTHLVFLGLFQIGRMVCLGLFRQVVVLAPAYAVAMAIYFVLLLALTRAGALGQNWRPNAFSLVCGGVLEAGLVFSEWMIFRSETRKGLHRRHKWDLCQQLVVRALPIHATVVLGPWLAIVAGLWTTGIGLSFFVLKILADAMTFAADPPC